MRISDLSSDVCSSDLGWPPRPADILNQISQRRGILPDSVRSDYALSWRYHHGAHRNGNKCGKTKGYPLIGSRPTADFTAPELLEVLRAVEVRGDRKSVV